MSFLQPLILWGLPLLLIPVVIHLLNRMRYRIVAWPTIMFLMTASKQATRQARLREWLILACRLLAVLALIFFLARPMAGGWLGWAAGNRPETVVVLLDRSPSMEAVDPQTHVSKRALAVRRLAEATGASGGGSRYVLIDSASRQPQEFASPGVLKDLSVAGASDAAADIPALLDAAIDYLQENRSGRAEIWLCSDLQRSNWQPDGAGWSALRERFRQRVQDTQVRLLALTQPTKENIAMRVTDVVRRRAGKGYELQLTVELTGQDAAPAAFPLTIIHEGARSQMEVKFGGQKTTTQCLLDLGPRLTAGWGWIELPPDSNPRDNQAFFVYPEAVHAKSLVVADSETAGRFLRLAAAPAPMILDQEAEIQSATMSLRLDDVALLIWQAAAPSGTVETAIRDFASSGGVVLYMPGAMSEEGKFRIATWRNSDGPLGKTQDAKDLPLPEVLVTKRTTLSSDDSVLAIFDDGKPFLTKEPIGRGAIYRCASLPVKDWSTLGEGTVLVPMVQRMVQEGGRRLGLIAEGDVGDPGFLRAASLAASDTNGVVSARTTAGIYRQDVKLAALNRPAREDDGDRLDERGVREAMGPIPYRLFEEQGGGASALPTELWRWFLIGMLLFLAGEAFLTLPTTAQMKRWDIVPGERHAFGKEKPAAGGPS